jgi:hypothetical protein
MQGEEKQEMKEIPERYYSDDENPAAYTVGELKALLNELPDDLCIQQGFGDGVVLVVYNHSVGEDVLAFEDNEEYE